jgi:U3 small nucleolar RNA-associated protein 18
VSLTDDASKDDEERRLEGLLFGVPFVSAKQNANDGIAFSDEAEDMDGMADGVKELENMLDTDVSGFLLLVFRRKIKLRKQLFYVDDGAGSPSKDIPELDNDFDVSVEQGGFDGQVTPDNEDSVSAVDEDKRKPAPYAEPISSKGRKTPAWTDPDDITLQVSLASDKRLRKLRDAPSEDAVGGREYERRLRRQYEKINPTPGWAFNARKKLHPAKSKRRRSSISSNSQEEQDEEEDILPDLLSSTGGLLSTAANSRVIPKGTLALERLRDANQAAQSEGEVKTLQFHPSPQIPVLVTASADRRVRLFNVCTFSNTYKLCLNLFQIDGHTNPHLQTLHIPALPLTTAHFHPLGSALLLTGPRPFYYTYDLQSGTTQRSPRGLWGTTFNHSHPQIEESSMEICSFSPTGEILAVAGRRGYVHLVDWKSGAGQVVGSLKMNAGVKSLWWVRGRNGEGRELMSLSDDSEVYVWDVAERRCTRRWQDDGAFGSRIMQGDPGGKYLAIGYSFYFQSFFRVLNVFQC